MSQCVCEVTVVLEMNDGGGVTTPDQFAAVVPALISVAGHAWLRNSSIKAVNVRSGDIVGFASGDVVPPEG